MLINKAAFLLNKVKNRVDWKLLTFLLLFLNVKLGIKILVIILYTLIQFNFKFGFSFNNSRLPLFYPLVIIIAIANWFTGSNNSSINYTILLFTGIGFWVVCILAIHQVKLAVEQNTPAVLHQTIVVFFIINAIFSIGNLLVIFLHTHEINPYTYQGELQKYSISTGDYVRGITFDTSTTNAVLSSAGVIYFLTRRKAVMLFVCMVTLLLTGSNFINLVTVAIFLLLFAFKTNRYQKSLIMVCLVFLTVFMAKISPQNNKYASETIAHLFHKELYANSPPAAYASLPITLRPDSVLNPEEHREKTAKLYLDSVYVATHPKIEVGIPAKPVFTTDNGRIAIQGPDINSAPYQSSTKTPADEGQLVSFISSHKAALPLAGENIPMPSHPGKLTGFLQTIIYLKGNLNKLLTGTGTGNFSSKLAFRATGLGFAGGYPQKFIYIKHDFLVNHLDLYAAYFSKRAGFHSLTNSPFSVYDQLLSEYGLAGIVVFMVFYLGFFVKDHKKLTYGLPLLLLMLAAFFVDYWFEQLSIIVFIELMLLLNIKESQTLKPVTNEF